MDEVMVEYLVVHLVVLMAEKLVELAENLVAYLVSLTAEYLAV